MKNINKAGCKVMFGVFEKNEKRKTPLGRIQGDKHIESVREIIGQTSGPSG